MTDRRGGATTDAGDRPARPPLVEMAAALLIVTGAIQLLSAIGAVATGNLPPDAGGLLALTVAIDVATIAAGVLVRAGRLWLLVVNYVAVIGFLDLLRSTQSIVAVVLAVVDLAVLYVLFTNREWFDRSRREAPDEPDEAPTID
ncbi:MAG TPA: hypothetical protein VFV72_03400 [Candidatus Limnocylindrales bacterium]|nr:hypothetical protein [Candidatus Limnocylindrales bacterium]